MTFDEALMTIQTNSKKRVRHKDMSTGWTMRWDHAHEIHLFTNPHTGSELSFELKDRDKTRTDWVVVP